MSLIQKLHDHTLRLITINHFQNSEISAVFRIVLLSLLTGVCAMQLHFMALTPPMQQFVLHSQLTSMIAWGIGFKVIVARLREPRDSNRDTNQSSKINQYC